MADFVIAVIAFCSATIFVAHLIEAFVTNRGRLPAPEARDRDLAIG